jgi:cytochrome c553
MSDPRSVQLLAACDQGDEARMEQLGWRPVLDALRYWPKRLTGDHLAPYCSLLGDEDPAALAACLRTFAAETTWRPAPAEVYVRLRGLPEPEPQRPGTPVTRRDNTPQAYQAVLDEVVMGAEVCDCIPRSPQVTVDRHGVLRCAECDRLEAGQYDQAMRWADPHRPEPPAPTAEDVRRWARDEQLLRLRQGKQPSPFLRKVMGGDDDAMRKLAASFGLSFEGKL